LGTVTTRSGGTPQRSRFGHGDGHVAAAFAEQVQQPYAAGGGAALELVVEQRVLGRDDAPDPGQPSGQAAVEAGAVEVGVHHVVAAAPDQPRQPHDGAELRVPVHAEVGDADAVGTQLLGHRRGVVQRDHVGLGRAVRDQQPELRLRATRREAGDDVQDPHAVDPRNPIRGVPAPGGGIARTAGRAGSVSGRRGRSRVRT
jgi:hypothetical protein